MTTTLRIALLIGVIIYTTIIIAFLRRGKLNLRYSLLWLVSAFAFLIIAAFPGIIITVSSWLGIQVAANAVFAILIFCILLILISLTSIASKQSEEIKNLNQAIAILERRVSNIEKNTESTEDDSK